jgi:hypothetical protein
MTQRKIRMMKIILSRKGYFVNMSGLGEDSIANESIWSKRSIDCIGNHQMYVTDLNKSKVDA